MCDFPSEPLYTRHTFGMVVPSRDRPGVVSALNSCFGSLISDPSREVLVGRRELERGAHGAGGEPPGHPLGDGADRLDPRAVLRDHVLEVEAAKGVDYPRDARFVEPAQMEAADDRV